MSGYFCWDYWHTPSGFFFIGLLMHQTTSISPLYKVIQQEILCQGNILYQTQEETKTLSALQYSMRFLIGTMYHIESQHWDSCFAHLNTKPAYSGPCNKISMQSVPFVYFFVNSFFKCTILYQLSVTKQTITALICSSVRPKWYLMWQYKVYRETAFLIKCKSPQPPTVSYRHKTMKDQIKC